jgi:hypothetical protein
MTAHHFSCPRCGQPTSLPRGTAFPAVATCPSCKVQFCCVAPNEPEPPPVQTAPPTGQQAAAMRRPMAATIPPLVSPTFSPTNASATAPNAHSIANSAPSTAAVASSPASPVLHKGLSKNAIILTVLIATGGIWLSCCGLGVLFLFVMASSRSEESLGSQPSVSIATAATHGASTNANSPGQNTGKEQPALVPAAASTGPNKMQVPAQTKLSASNISKAAFGRLKVKSQPDVSYEFNRHDVYDNPAGAGGVVIGKVNAGTILRVWESETVGSHTWYYQQGMMYHSAGGKYKGSRLNPRLDSAWIIDDYVEVIE